jgi:hypothetical protein
MKLPSAALQRYVDSRVKDIELASQRSRWVWAALLTISWLMVSVSFSSTWSWSRSMAESTEKQWNLAQPQASAMPPLEPLRRFDATDPEAVSGGLDRRNPVDWMRMQYLRSWTDSLFFEVPILGARFSAADAGIIGGVALLLLGCWGFYTARRENHQIYYFIRDIQEKRYLSAASRAYARNQLIATQIFTSGWHDDPLVAEHLETKPDEVRSNDRLMRFILLAMFFLPVLALLFVLASDLHSLRIDSPFRQGPDSLWVVITKNCDPDYRGCSAFLELSARLIIAAILLLLQAVVAWKAYAFQRATSGLLTATYSWKGPTSRRHPGKKPKPAIPNPLNLFRKQG